MSSTHKYNPDKGGKVTSDPTSYRDPKAEAAGPVAQDSLAADSMRSGGSFASGPNPAGISGVKGSNSTFAAVPQGDEKVKTFEGKRPDNRDDVDIGGRADDKIKSQAGRVGASGGEGMQREQGYMGGEGVIGDKDATGNEMGAGTYTSKERSSGGSSGGGGGGDIDSARGSKHSGGSSGQPQESTGSQKEGSSQSQSTSSSGGKHYGGETTVNTATNPTHEIFTSGGKKEGKVGDSAEDVDWSKISKDTKTTTDIGSEDDPGRAAEQKLMKQSMSTGYTEDGKVPKGDNQFENLKAEEQI